MRYEMMMMNEGTALRYALVLPAGFTPAETYPVLLAMPPGPQTEAMVEAGLTYWQQEAQQRGWIVISPVAPDGVLFFQGSDQLMPEFLDGILGLYRVENGRFHLAGVSNGGISAFRIAAAEPERFQSMLVIPGRPAYEADFKSLDRLVDLPIAMYVGERDTDWVGRMQETEARLAELGTAVTLEIVPSEGHVVRSIPNARLFDFFDAHRSASGQ
jgi:dipeptidyl aminopeptidase/acylaminoacyl peptidase